MKKKIEYFLTRFKEYDILNIIHRKSITDLLVRKIYLYDDDMIFTPRSGVGEIEITAEFYTDIRANGILDTIFIPQGLVHQKLLTNGVKYCNI